MKLQIAKGMNDTSPEEMIKLQELTSFLKEVFEIHGYSPLDTPAIEKYEVLSAKYAGGTEILKETFKLKDQGERDLGLRYDLTVPLTRFVGMNPTLKMPFKRYHMAKVWRDGPIGLGRFREFWQCDVDIVGVKKMSAEAELFSIVETVFKKLGLKYKVMINNRKLLNGILETFEVKNKEQTILTIDKIQKVSEKQLIQELLEQGLKQQQTQKLLETFYFKGTLKQKLELVKKTYKENKNVEQGILELETLIEYLNAYNFKEYDLDLSLSRGLAFYTGTVFETILLDSKIKSSVASGGRYDEIIGKFLENNQEYPCVGISFGLSRIIEAIEKKDSKKTVTELFVIPIGDKEIELKTLPIIKKIRSQGIKTEIDLLGRGLSKNLNYANANKIPYVLFVGEDELKKNVFKLRNMTTGKEENLKIEDAITSIIKQIKT